MDALNLFCMLTDDEVTALQLAVQSGDTASVKQLVAEQPPDYLTSLQLFADHTLLMYACEHSTAEVVQVLIDSGVESFDLEWSVNNELKSTLRNEKHRAVILPLILEVIPEEMREEMIATDWDPEEMSQGEASSPLEMAADLPDGPRITELLQKHLGG